MAVEVLPFYGHAKKADYAEFSNFWEHKVKIPFTLPEYARKPGFPETIYISFSEAAIMAVKAAMFGDKANFELIVKANTPGQAKALGRKVRNFDGAVWNRHLEETAFQVVYQKFNSSSALRQLLLKTGNKLIVEASPNDAIWGVGLSKSDPRIWDPAQWQGKNVLGTALMQAREQLRSGTREVPGSSSAQEAPSAAPAKDAASSNVLPFYGHGPGVEYAEFSNFWWHDAKFPFALPEYARKPGFPETIHVNFSEAAIMAVKAAMFGDKENFDLIVNADNPDTAKALGREVKSFDGKVWTQHLEKTAFEVVYQKFKSSSALQQLLLNTGKKVIVEAAPHDAIWGVGLDKSDSRIWDPAQWQGKNVLGRALMKARSQLRSDAEDEEVVEVTKKPRWGRKNAAEAAEHPPEPDSDPPDCYVVLDFEATCDKPVQVKPQEIIEFPMVLVDATSHKKVKEFRTYVRPTANPKITAFCTELTGITQEQVDVAPAWSEALRLGEAWLREQSGYSRPLFVTCGDWDLRQMVVEQCKQCQQPVPGMFKKWLNIKNLFMANTGKPSTGMKGMLESLEMPLEGRHHSGLDDCRNIARILAELLRRGTIQAFAQPRGLPGGRLRGARQVAAACLWRFLSRRAC
ncbi:unnamed protein product [Effrenium voratum]|nr:unnamed protein product [Effrenium voratum]